MSRRWFLAGIVSLLPIIGVAAEKVIATVNGETIALTEVEKMISLAPPSLTPLTSAQKRQQMMETVSVLVDEKLIRQFLSQQPITVDAADVQKQVVALEASLAGQKKTLADYLREMNLTEAQIRDNFRMMLQLAKYIDTLVTEEKLKAYFADNRDFFEQSTVRTSHIVIRVASDATAEEREKAKSKLTDLRTQIAAKKFTFAEAAKEHSQCPSAPKGGDIGFVNRKWQVDEAYARAAFQLEIGHMSDVVTSEYGYHLITVTEKKPGKAVKYEDIQREVRECFETEVRQQLLANLRKKAKVAITLP